MTRKTPTTKSRKVPKVPVRKSEARRAPRKVDFGDEKAVLKEVCKELDIDPSDCSIKLGSAPNGYGSAYIINEGRRAEYVVMENDDEFESAAREGVERDIRDEPGNFNENFIQGHIDLDKLRDALHSDLSDSNFEGLQDEAERHPMKFLKDHDIDIPSPSQAKLRLYCEEANEESLEEDRFQTLDNMDPEEQWDTIGEEPEVTHAQITEVADDLATAQLKDPLEYLADIYGGHEAPKKAIEIAGIDAEKAADEAVSNDGAEHFMCNYDGNYDTTKSGFIVWRHN